MVINTNLTAEELDFASCLKSDYDPFIERDIIPNIPKPRRKKTEKYTSKYREISRRAQHFQARPQKQSERGSLVILRFLRADGYAEFRIQRDISDNVNEDGTKKLKGKPGFIFGSPDSSKEPDEIVAQRETNEEALIPDTVGKLEFVDNIHPAKDYYIAVFVKTVSFDTVDGKGEDVYEYDRYSRKEVEMMIKNGEILFQHLTAWNMAVAGGFI